MGIKAHIIDRVDTVKSSIGNSDIKEELYDFLTDHINIVRYTNPDGGDFEGWEVDVAELTEFVKDLEATVIPYPDTLKDVSKCETLADPANLVNWLKELIGTSHGRSCVFVEWF